MAIVDKLRPLWFPQRIEFKDDRHGFAPIGAFFRCVEQAQIRYQMPLIVFRKSVTYWRTIIKVWRLHLMSLTVTIFDMGTIVQKITQ
jgi:hypothetical protein